MTVEDDGGRNLPGPPPSKGSGYGIVGMRERALGLGGALDAAPKPGGGFRVLATLPFRTRQ